MSTPSLFSFQGRIRRKDYLLTTMVVIDLLLIIQLSLEADESSGLLMVLAAFSGVIASGWIGLAAAVKRCHDLGHNGLYTLIPFYGLLLIFMDGTPWENEYGPDPKAGRQAVPEASSLPLFETILILLLGLGLMLAVRIR
jgi:uncharacterized membrane protein YhaH (DUF805 family)